MQHPIRTGSPPSLALALMLASPPAHAGPVRQWTGNVDTAWQTAGNWNPLGTPDPGELALINSTLVGADVTVVLLANNVPVESLAVAGGTFSSQLITNGRRLTVQSVDLAGQASIFGAGAAVYVWPDGGNVGFLADNLEVLDGAALVQHLGGITSVGDQMVVAEGGSVSGWGDVILANEMNTVSTVLDLDGALTASGGPLVVQTLQGGLVDLDGPATSISAFSTPGSSVTIDADLAGPFGADALMFIGAGNIVSFTAPLDVDGEVSFVSDGQLVGPDFDFRDGSRLFIDGVGAVVNGITVFEDGSVLDMTPDTSLSFPQPVALGAGALIDVDGSLFLSASTDYDGATIHSGPGGHLQQLGDLNVLSDTTIDMPTGFYTLGLPPGGVDVDIWTGATLVIDVQNLGNGAVYGSTTVSGGVLEVHTQDPWSIEGELVLNTGELRGGEAIVRAGAHIDTIGFQDAIDAPLRVEPDGVIDVGSALFVGGTLTFEGGWMTGTGTVHLDGDLVARGDAQSLLSVQTIDWDGSVESLHATTVEAGATLALSVDDIDNAPPPFFDGYDGTVLVEPLGTLAVFTADGFWRLDGTLTLGGGVAVVDGSDVTNRGRIEGTGFVTTDVTSTGLVAPGESAGQVNITGAYDQDAAGDLEIELGGTAPGDTFDVLTTGPATLAGRLHVRLIDGYEPPPGQTFTVLTASSISGQFDEIIDQAGVTVSYTPTDVVLTYVGGAIPADVDGSGAVDVEDLVDVIIAWGTCPHNAICPEDLDNDGDVDVNDLVAVILGWS